MNLAELHDELERLGSRPVPLPDDDRLEALEQRLLREFVVTAPPADPVPTLDAARRRRRQVIAAGLAAAAAALATAMVLTRGGEPSYEVSAATGAVAMYPDGASRQVQAGDRVPAGGLIRTGPVGGVTIEDTTVGADHVILLDDDNIALLPTRPSSRPVDTPPPAPVVTAPATAPPTAAPVTLVPTIATPPPPAPAALNPAPLRLTVIETGDGVQLSWTPTDAVSFERYVVVRGTADSGTLVDVAELPDLHQTSFIDTTPPTGVELCYKVVAVDADGLPVAVSETITVVVEGTGSSNEIPPSTDTAPTIQPTGPAPTTAPSSTAVDTTAAATTETDPTAVDTTLAGSEPEAWPPATDGQVVPGNDPPTGGEGGSRGDRGNEDWGQDNGG